MNARTSTSMKFSLQGTLVQANKLLIKWQVSSIFWPMPGESDCNQEEPNPMN